MFGSWACFYRHKWINPIREVCISGGCFRRRVASRLLSLITYSVVRLWTAICLSYYRGLTPRTTDVRTIMAQHWLKWYHADPTFIRCEVRSLRKRMTAFWIMCFIYSHISANIKHSPNGCTMLVQRRRRWDNIVIPDSNEWKILTNNSAAQGFFYYLPTAAAYIFIFY